LGGPLGYPENIRLDCPDFPHGFCVAVAEIFHHLFFFQTMGVTDPSARHYETMGLVHFMVCLFTPQSSHFWYSFCLSLGFSRLSGLECLFAVSFCPCIHIIRDIDFLIVINFQCINSFVNVLVGHFKLLFILLYLHCNL